MKISGKIQLLGLGLLVAFLVLVGWILGQYQSSLYNEKRVETQLLAEAAGSIARRYAALEERGALDRNAAQARALEALEASRYGVDGYFWVHDFANRVVSHPKAEIVGKDQTETRDVNGVALFAEMTRIARTDGAGFLEYHWPKAGSTEAEPKFSYVTGVPAWGWVIGTGMYVDDVAAEITAARNAILLACLMLALLMGAALLWFAARLSSGVREVTAVAHRIAAGDIEQEVHHHSSDETGELADAFRSTLDYLREIARGADGIATGDLDTVVAPRSEADLLARNFGRATAVLRELIRETTALAAAARAGRLAVRADGQRFEGGYRSLVVGLNEVLDAVVEPVEEATTALERLADGDLTARVEGEYEGDFSRIKEAVNTAASSLDRTLHGVALAAEEVAGAAREISDGSQNLAGTTSEQASSLEEIASSLQELSATSRQNTDGAGQASGMASRARASAGTGNERMIGLVEAMDQIRESASATAGIIKTIDEIAFQTNLLSLNAAVEAARAGEAGLGFAVVAQEVRALALQSARAAAETAELIQESLGRVDVGVGISREVRDHLQEIDGEVEAVVAAVTEIASASTQQSGGIEEVNAGVEQLNLTTQAAAAHAEQSASAATELSGQAARVRELVAQFRLTEGRATAPRPPSPTAAPAARPPLHRTGRAVSLASL